MSSSTFIGILRRAALSGLVLSSVLASAAAPAPAQVGQHIPERHAHGETVVVDPWGTVVGRRLRGVGLVQATIDLDHVDRVRRGLPCLKHTRKEMFGWPGRR